MKTQAGNPDGSQKKPHLSRDEKWRSFPKVPNLLQYVGSGAYYARVKVGGKTIRQSLGTDVWSTAKLRLTDFLKDHRVAATPEQKSLFFSEAAARLKEKVGQDVSMKASSKEYRVLCLRKIESSWRDLFSKRIDEITESECLDWAATLQRGVASQYFNNVVGTLRMIFDIGLEEFEGRTGRTLKNPARRIPKARIRQTQLALPEPEQFKTLVEEIDKHLSWGKAAAELVEFLAYSGMRLYTEAQWVTWGDVDWKRKEIIVRGNPETGTKNWEIRRIPILPDMENLLKRLEGSQPKPLEQAILRIKECPGNLARACKKLGLPRLSHHDLRHLFATRCIESGVDIPTVSRWLGHKDGGALAMKTYGHLRNEHSRQMAEKVRF